MFDKKRKEKRAILHNGLLKVQITGIYEGWSTETVHIFSHDRLSMSKDVKAAVRQWFQQCPREFVAEGIHWLMWEWDSYLSTHWDYIQWSPAPRSPWKGFIWITLRFECIKCYVLHEILCCFLYFYYEQLIYFQK